MTDAEHPNAADRDDRRPTVGVTPLRHDRSVSRGPGTCSIWLLARQDPAGFWCAELEGDTTLESYMILLEAFFGRRGSAEHSLGLARIIRERDAARRAAGRSTRAGRRSYRSQCSATSRSRSRASAATRRTCSARATRSVGLGGVERANTYTQYHLALFGQYAGATCRRSRPRWCSCRGASDPSRSTTCPAGRARSSCRCRSCTRRSRCALARRARRRRSCSRRRRRRRRRLPATPGLGPPWKKVFFGVDRLLKAYERLPGAGALRRLAIERASRLDDRAARGLRRPVGDLAGHGELGDGAQSASGTPRSTRC